MILVILESVMGAENARLPQPAHPALFSGDAVSRFRVLSEHYREPLMRYVSRRLRPTEAAEDVVALTFEAAFRNLRRLQQSQDPYLWLLGIARRKVADAYRVRDRRREEPIPAEMPALTPDPQAMVLDREQASRVRSAVLNLPEDHREAILLQHLEKLNQRQIGEVLGRSPEAVNSLLQRARQRLQSKLAPYFPELEETHV